MAGTDSNVPVSATCITCEQVFSLDIVLRHLDEDSKNIFIQRHTHHFQCELCFGTIPSSSVCHMHLMSFKLAFLQRTEDQFKEVYKLAERMQLLMHAYSFFTDLPNSTECHFRNFNLHVDHNAMNYLEAYVDVRKSSHTAFEVAKDGDCLFNTVSLALWKTELHSKQLRLRMALEVITKRTKYDRFAADSVADLFSQSFSLFDTYLQFVSDSLTVSAYMTPSHIAALANALCVPIQLSLPRTPADAASNEFLPSEMNKHISLNCSGPIQLEEFSRGWSVHTTTSMPVEIGQSHADVCNFTQNHFCLLVSNTLFRNAQEADEENFSDRDVRSDEDDVYSEKEVLNCLKMSKLPFEKPLKSTQMLHELQNVDTSHLQDNVLQYNSNMANRYYFCLNPRGPFIDDNFTSLLPTPYNNTFTKQKAYIVQHGRYVELQRNFTSYTFKNGLPLTQEELDSIIYLYTYRVTFGHMARLTACLTNSDFQWVDTSPILVMYSSQPGRANFRKNKARDASGAAVVKGKRVIIKKKEAGPSYVTSASYKRVETCPAQLTPDKSVDISRSGYNPISSTTGQSPAKGALLLPVSPERPSNPSKETDKLKFLSPLSAYDVITTGALSIVSEPPPGVKNNVRYLVAGDHSKSKLNGKQVYIDDLFRKSVGRSSTFHYLMPFRLRLQKEGETYYANGPGGSSVVGGEVVTIIRRKAKASSCDLVRCVTTVLTTSDTLHPVLWEYSGEGRKEIHPNDLRTHPNKVFGVMPTLKHVQAKIVYRETVVSGENTVRDTEVYSNAKRREKKAAEEAAGGCSSEVYADQVLSMLCNQTKKLLPICTVISLPDLPVMFHLGADYVFEDICRFCLSHEALVKQPPQTKQDNRVRKLGVLGIDKTYNITSCHVTTTVYQNFGLVHNKTASKGKNPFFLGPVLIHQSSTEPIFSRFLYEIELRLRENGYTPNTGPQVVMCDGELAIRKAVTNVWPKASVYHCYQHLKGNLSNQLKYGKKSHLLRPEAKELLQDNIFYRIPSLGSKTTVVSFKKRMNEILESVGNADADDDSGIQEYLTEVLFPKMIENIEISQKYPDMDLLMTTNNPTESLNHELKRRGHFKPQSITAFAKSLKVQEYDFRRNETFRALLETGDYRLSNFFKEQFTETKSRTWYSYVTQSIHDEDKKEKYIAKFQKTALSLNSCLSEDGRLARSTTSTGSLVTLVPKPRAAKNHVNGSQMQ